MEILLESTPVVFELMHSEDNKLHRWVALKHIMKIKKNMQLGLELNWTRHPNASFLHMQCIINF